MANFLFAFSIQFILNVNIFFGLNAVIKAAEIGRTNDSVSLFTNANDKTVLDSIGQVALKMVEHIAAAEDEKVEMNLISEFVQALSRAAIMMENPQIPQLDDIKVEFISLKEEMREEKEKLIDQIEFLAQKLEQSEQRGNRSASTIRHLIELTNKTKLGFTATSTTNQGLSAGTIVKFEKVQVNEGNHYDPALGIFICPLTGLYMMSVTIAAYSNSQHIQVDLTVDGANQFRLYNHANSNHHYNSVSQSGLVRCNAGSKIWVQAYGDGKSWGGQYTSFSGFLYETL